MSYPLGTVSLALPPRLLHTSREGFGYERRGVAGTAGPSRRGAGAAVGRPVGGLRGHGGSPGRAGRDGPGGGAGRPGERRRARGGRANAGGREGPPPVLPGRGVDQEPDRGRGRGGGQRQTRQ